MRSRFLTSRTTLISQLASQLASQLTSQLAFLLVLLLTIITGSVMASSKYGNFTADYSFARNGIVMGKMTRSLNVLDDGTYLYESSSRATGFISWFIKDRIVERSKWRYVNNKPRPSQYSYHRTKGKRERHADLSFDWEQGIVTNNINNKPWHMPVPPEALDKLLYQIAMMIDLRDGKKELEYQVADGGKLKLFKFTVLGEEPLDSKLGTLHTIKLQRTNDERQTTIWCAPALDYLPIRIEQVEEDGSRLTINIKKVTGLPATPPLARKITH